MGADPPPDDVGFVGDQGATVFEGRPSIVRPGQLEDPGRAPDSLHAEPVSKALSVAQILGELRHCFEECRLLPRRERIEVGAEACEPGEGRQRRLLGRPPLATLGASAERVEELAVGGE